MNQNDKKKRVLEIMQELQEIYPHLDRVILEDVDKPTSIIVTSSELMAEVAREHGIDPELLEEATTYAEDVLKSDDDDDNGPLQ